jgi:hypothetical protein
MSCFAAMTRASSGRLMIFGTTSAASMPRMTTTTITSSKVNPHCPCFLIRIDRPSSSIDSTARHQPQVEQHKDEQAKVEQTKAEQTKAERNCASKTRVYLI